MRSGPSVTLGQQETLKTQSVLVERRSAAVAAYATKLAEFKAATARQPGTEGINLDAAEARRREGVLVGLVLDCIDAVNQYNLALEEPSVSQRHAAGLPVRFDWTVDCNVGQGGTVLATEGRKSNER